jgi:hypothetical protein
MRQLLSNELNAISGGRVDFSINFDLGRYPEPYYEVYPEVVYRPVVVDSYDVITPVCDRYGCYNIVDTYEVIENRPFYYY